MTDDTLNFKTKYPTWFQKECACTFHTETGKTKAIAVLLGTLLIAAQTYSAVSAKQMNVISISIDDLNDYIGCYDVPVKAQTPNLDRFAKRGVLFTTANCAAPLCNPSRVALWTGCLPSTSGIYENSHYQRDSAVLKDKPVMQEYFRSHGYTTWGSGKIFHNLVSGNLWLNPQAWDEYVSLGGAFRKGPKSHGFGEKELVTMFDWGPNNFGGEESGDTKDFKNALWAVKKIQQKHSLPFFLCYGSVRPHLPLCVPPSFYSLYPLDSISMPSYLENDLDDVPPIGKKFANTSPFASKTDQATRDFHHELTAKGKAKEVVQAYLASITFADKCVGEVLNAIEQSPEADNTIIFLWGDNGWHLGEKSHWQKCTLWERSARVPLMIYVPGLTPPEGGVCNRPVSLVDLYPTMLELCGLPRRDDLEGHSLVPLLKNPSSEWPYPAITSYQKGNHSVRTERWRYIRYNDGTEELYDMKKDPNESENLANNSEYKTVVEDHHKMLPKNDAEPVVRSNHTDDRFNLEVRKKGYGKPESKDKNTAITDPVE